MAVRVALYARYSTDLQSDASVEDQLRICRTRAEREGWTVVESYSDRAISGASMLRPGIQALMEDAGRRRFDVVLAEAMDRLSRDQEDIAVLYKRLRFAGVSIVTIAEGEINEMHIGLKGTMNALALKDLAQKTHRGLLGRVEAGLSAGDVPMAMTWSAAPTTRASRSAANGRSTRPKRRSSAGFSRWRQRARARLPLPRR